MEGKEVWIVRVAFGQVKPWIVTAKLIPGVQSITWSPGEAIAVAWNQTWTEGSKQSVLRLSGMRSLYRCGQLAELKV